jgi:hypothetical protein
VRVVSGGLDDPNLPPEARAAISNALAGGPIGGSIHAGPGGAVVTHSGTITMPPVVSVRKPGPDGTMESAEPEILSPERIVIETPLEENFTNDVPLNPTREAAERAAHKVKGRCTTLYALGKSDFPGLVIHSLKGLHGGGLSSGLPLDLQGNPTNPAAMADRMAQALQREKVEQYQKLTPEQRARRAREMRALSSPVETNK